MCVRGACVQGPSENILFCTAAEENASMHVRVRARVRLFVYKCSAYEI